MPRKAESIHVGTFCRFPTSATRQAFQGFTAFGLTPGVDGRFLAFGREIVEGGEAFGHAAHHGGGVFFPVFLDKFVFAVEVDGRNKAEIAQRPEVGDETYVALFGLSALRVDIPHIFWF